MSKPSLRRLVLVPALITLAVTLLRLTGELLRWSPSLFGREAGGGASIVGIVWLIFVFGIYFALRLARAGEEPAGLGRALGWPALAFILNSAVFVGAVSLLPSNPVAQLGLFTVGSWVAIFVARRGWPEMWRVLLAYGVLARIPVLVIMFLSIFGGWDTHYAKPRPDFPAMGPWGLFFWTALLPQMGIWIYLTVVLGMLMGAGTIGIRRLMRRPGAALTSPVA
ncbi:MAG TPA: hypothetical protein VMT87_14625 [Vicinamibacteria bacterium]|nr:hypothetical protein [Vicinamibacteria bacterium]